MRLVEPGALGCNDDVERYADALRGRTTEPLGAVGDDAEPVCLVEALEDGRRFRPRREAVPLLFETFCEFFIQARRTRRFRDQRLVGPVRAAAVGSLEVRSAPLAPRGFTADDTVPEAP